MSGWRLREIDGTVFAVCDALAALPGVQHAFSTRRGSADLGGHGDVDPGTLRRRREFFRATGLGGREAAPLHQVHGNRVVACAEALRASTVIEADAVVDAGPRGTWVAAVRWADCVPLLLADVEGRAVAAVHAGWRGTAAGIAGRAVAFLAEAGIPPERLVAAVGPAIGVCCYEVDRSVLRAVAQATGIGASGISRPGQDDGPYLDLQLANRLQLEHAGVGAESIRTAPWCTACRADLFYSYRRDRGPTGRQLACIGRAAA